MTDPTSHDEIVELLGAYALHAVDPAEESVVEEHLADCPRCRAEVAEHREVAALLGNSGGSAPEGLWDRILDALEEPAPPMRLDLSFSGDVGTVVPLASRAPRSARAARMAAFALGAAAAVVIAVLGVKVLQQDQELDDMQAALVDETLMRAANTALTDSRAQRATLTSPDGEVAVVAVVLPDGTGYLMADALPALPGDRTYQLWGQTEGGLVSLGVLGGEPQIVPFHTSGSLDLLAVTEEAAGGVVASEEAPTVAGTVS